MKEQIKRIIKAKELCCIYSDKNDTCSFMLGYILTYSEDRIVIQSIDKNGLTDGFSLKMIDEIFLIETKTDYIEAINKKHPNIIETADFLLCNTKSLTYNLLYYAMNNKSKISIQLHSSGYSDADGYVSNITEQSVSISLTNERGVLLGEAVCILNAITQVFCSVETATV